MPIDDLAGYGLLRLVMSKYADSDNKALVCKIIRRGFISGINHEYGTTGLKNRLNHIHISSMVESPSGDDDDSRLHRYNSPLHTDPWPATESKLDVERIRARTELSETRQTAVKGFMEGRNFLELNRERGSGNAMLRFAEATAALRKTAELRGPRIGRNTAGAIGRIEWPTK